jgi:hypothetical protein
MRIIIEASKSKRRVVEPEVADSGDTQRRALPRAPVAEPAVIASRSFVPASVQQPPPAPVAAAVAAPVAASPAASASAPVSTAAQGGAASNSGAITTEITLTSDDLQLRADNVARPALDTAARPPVVAALPAATAALPALLEVKPKIVSMVDPVVTPALLEGVRRDSGVTADLVIRADGSVASVSVLPPASRQLVRAVVAALEQWRFEPLPGDRQHRVQLVFSD